MVGSGHGRTLKGIKEISGYIGLSEATILDFIKQADFPAKKSKEGPGGIYISNTAAIDRWSARYSEGRLAVDVEKIAAKIRARVVTMKQETALSLAREIMENI